MKFILGKDVVRGIKYCILEKDQIKIKVLLKFNFNSIFFVEQKQSRVDRAGNAHIHVPKLVTLSPSSSL